MRSFSFDTVLFKPLAGRGPGAEERPLSKPAAPSRSDSRSYHLNVPVASVTPSAEAEQKAAEAAELEFAKSTLPQAPDQVPVVDPDATPAYVQAVLEGKHPFIITNLLQEQSTIIWQPQYAWTIGRNRDAALPLRDEAMSRRHAVLVYLKDIGFQLVDLNSMNGVYVNGHRIQQRCLLLDGDRIRIGNTIFSFLISHHQRTVEHIHPEVLSRFQGLQPHPRDFVDYVADEGDLVFNSLRR